MHKLVTGLCPSPLYFEDNANIAWMRVHIQSQHASISPTGQVAWLLTFS